MSPVGMIPNAQNPYTWEDQMVRPYEPPEMTVLTVKDIDRMMAARLHDASREASEAKRHACITAWEEGRHFGQEQAQEQAQRAARETIDKVVRGRLQHIVRHLRMDQRRKTTIAEERKWMDAQAVELERAIRELEA